MDVKKLVSQMTLEEKAGLCSGDDFWHTKAVERLGIPRVMVSDGPHGLRKQSDAADHLGINDSIRAVCFPAASATAASFDPDMIREMGEALGDSCQHERVSVVLGPAVNIKRSPLCGRNFEYFSEDPYLAGQMAAAMIRGVQSRNVGTSIKHFAANSQEKRRQTSDSIIDERALREIYLYSFEKSVKESAPATVMESYNKLNGEYASRSRRLLQEILRDEWGFDGVVVSDWGAAINIAECIKGGLDLAMPDSCGFHTDELKAALAEGRITESDIDRAVENIVRLAKRLKPEFFGADAQNDASPRNNGDFTATGKKAAGISPELFAKAHEIAKNAACDSAVLLKNDGMLPIKPHTGDSATQATQATQANTVAIIGEMARTIRFQGGGSSHITTNPIKDAVKAFEAKGFTVLYEPGYSEEYARKIAIGKAGAKTAAAQQRSATGDRRSHPRLPKSWLRPGCSSVLPV